MKIKKEDEATIVIEDIKQNIIIMEGKTCWLCGKPFDFSDKIHIGNKTAHHSIEKRFHPKKNVIIPICKNCHDFMHKTSTQINAVKSKIKGLNNYINELNGMLEEIK